MISPRAKTNRTRPGFSMAELMIAIVILGLGLLMVATMFPVAWTRARDMAEFTTQSAAGDIAGITVEGKTVVTRPDGSVDAPSFIGDVAPTSDTPRDPVLPLVHYMNMWNQLATNPGGPLAYEIEYQPSDDYSGPSPDISMDTLHAQAGEFIPLPHAGLFYDTNSVIHIADRVIPPLPPRPRAVGLPPELSVHRDKMVATRRFLWAAFSRFDRTPTRRADARSLTMYYVTLRRPESTNRYARQDPVNGVGLATREPTALPPAEDMRFPVPWLVDLDVRGSWEMTGATSGAPLPDAPRGIPSEAIAGGGANRRLIAQMLQTGSILIDRLTGAVYTVTKHRYTDTGDEYGDTAVVTLDREIQVSDIETAAIQQIPDVNSALTDGKVQVGNVADAANPLDPISDDLADGTIRPFWTFPPPIEKERVAPGYPTFSGKQPVVGFETRPLVKRP